MAIAACAPRLPEPPTPPYAPYASSVPHIDTSIRHPRTATIRQLGIARRHHTRSQYRRPPRFTVSVPQTAAMRYHSTGQRVAPA
eukprot:268088-Rhodomonas_salina.1